MRPADLEPLEMKIGLTVIEDLGIKLYTRLPPVLSEIVANSWDAESKIVQISLPDGSIDENSTIMIEDDGNGMTYEEIRNLYLMVGRKRREEEGTEETLTMGRPIMGRKGIGKLAVFGVAEIVEIETVKNHICNYFRMELGKILQDARETGRYKPEIVECEKRVDKEKGTVVRLKSLKRKSPIDPNSVRRGLARHFSIIGRGHDFSLVINGDELSPTDKFRIDDMEYHWPINDEVVNDEHPDWKLSGWIGATKTPLDEEDRGIVIMARGKLLQSPTTFESKVGEKYSYSYLTGEIEAEFIDKKEDLIGTARNSLVWESPQGESIKKWGQTKLRGISNELARLRREKKERVIREDPDFKEWLEHLSPGEGKIADKVIRALTSTETINDERRKELASFMKESFEQKVFHQMVASFSEDDTETSVKLLNLFKEWDVIEAREILRIVKGRTDAIKKFQEHIESDAREVPTIHNFFIKWPWILEPTWTRWQDEVYYSKLLRQHFPDSKLDEPNRRIDFVCIGVGDTVHVVELKRPGYSVESDDLDQLLGYKEFVKDRLGNVKGRGYKDASGYIVAGEISGDRQTRSKINLYESDRMYVKRYGDLLVVARQLHADYEQKLEEFEKTGKTK